MSESLRTNNETRSATVGTPPSDKGPGQRIFSYYTLFVLRVAESALKHGYSIEEISHAYDFFFAFEGIIDDGAQPPKILTIGPGSAGNFVELVGGRQPNGDHLVWHAMRCRRQYLTLLPGDGR